MTINKTPNILVIGDMIIDHYLWGNCERISQEAPVQVVDIQNETSTLGGAGNVAGNLASLGSNVTVVSVTGEDKEAIELKNMLDALDIKHILFDEKDRKTSKKSRIMASKAQVIRFDKEVKFDITKASQEKIMHTLENSIYSFDIVILSDYGKGVLTNELTKKIITLSKQYEIKILIDPKGDDYSKYDGAYLLTPNKKEATQATKIAIKDDKSLINALEYLKNDINISLPLITLSEDGIAILDDKLIKKPTVAREVYDVTGAGDTVIAALAFALANDFDILQSMEFANLAAGVVVGKLGCATVTIQDIEQYKATLHKSDINEQVKTLEQITQIAKTLKKNNKKIVFTNGCFDILHSGHVSYLHTAKSHGDVLILGLNDDASVKKIKGPLRPINNENDRACVLSGLQSVDFVVKFNDDTPYELIKAIVPDVLVKGGDYKGKDVVGSDIVNELILVDFVDGKSTSNIINKIKVQKDKNV